VRREVVRTNGTQTGTFLRVMFLRRPARTNRQSLRSQFFDYDISALFAEETSSAPPEVYLMSCDLATLPAPCLNDSRVDLVTISFHNPG
jgi:hypothetical protein